MLSVQEKQLTVPYVVEDAIPLAQPDERKPFIEKVRDYESFILSGSFFAAAIAVIVLIATSVLTGGFTALVFFLFVLGAYYFNHGLDDLQTQRNITQLRSAQLRAIEERARAEKENSIVHELPKKVEPVKEISPPVVSPENHSAKEVPQSTVEPTPSMPALPRKPKKARKIKSKETTKEDLSTALVVYTPKAKTSESEESKKMVVFAPQAEEAKNMIVLFDQRMQPYQKPAENLPHQADQTIANHKVADFFLRHQLVVSAALAVLTVIGHYYLASD